MFARSPLCAFSHLLRQIPTHFQLDLFRSPFCGDQRMPENVEAAFIKKRSIYYTMINTAQVCSSN